MVDFDKTYFDAVRKAKAEGNPVAGYIKAIKGVVHINAINTFTGTPETITLKGDPVDPEVDIDDITIFLWTDFEYDFFRKANKTLLEEGILVPYTKEVVEEISVNEVSDEVLEEALRKKFFATQALLKKFTSPVPVRRMLYIAERINKPIGTINAIKTRLAELQKTQEE